MSPLKQKLSWVVMEMVGNEELQLSHLFSVFPKMFSLYFFIKSHKQSNRMNIFLISFNDSEKYDLYYIKRLLFEKNK